MVQIWFPGLAIPKLVIRRGFFLDVSIFGVGLVIPPVDITLFAGVKIWDGFMLFDTDLIVKGIGDLMVAIPKAVWDLATSTLDDMAAVFYGHHSEAMEPIDETVKRMAEEIYKKMRGE
jgi:hypothetical protein